MNPQEPSILVGIDFSPCSEHALATAVALAQRLAVQLRVVHVFEPLAAVTSEHPHNYIDIETRLEKERLRQRVLCMELCDRVVRDRVLYTVHVLDAMALDGLLESIERFKPELVVVGSHGRGALKRMLLGSVSTALCRRSPVPVVVVPAEPHATPAEPTSDMNSSQT